MNIIKHVLLKGYENFIDYTKSVKHYKQLDAPEYQAEDFVLNYAGIKTTKHFIKNQF